MGTPGTKVLWKMQLNQCPQRFPCFLPSLSSESSVSYGTFTADFDYGKCEYRVPKKDLKEAVKDWLEKSGYPLEMHVANAFHKAGFRVAQSAYYTDTESGQQREIDIVATDKVSVGNTAIRMRFVVECKSSPKHPWVMLLPGTDRKANYRTTLGILTAGGGQKSNALRAALSKVDSIANLPLFEQGPADFPAYGMVQALGSGNDASFSALMQVAKAATALATEKSDSKLVDLLQPEAAALTFPTIVLDGALFAARLRDTGEGIAMTERRQHALLIANPRLGGYFPLISVLTKDALPEHMANVVTARDAIFQWCRANEQSLLNELKQYN
jgi:hypothetical protein